MNAPVQMTHPVQAWLVDQVLQSVAHRLEQGAHQVFAEHTSDGKWNDNDPAREQHDEDLRLARDLRALLVQLRGPGAAPAMRIDRGDDGRGLYERAVDVTRQDGEASVGMLCRALSVDESAARRLLAEMQRTGVVAEAVDGWHKVRVS